MPNRKQKPSRRKSLPEYTYLGCPMTRNRGAQCLRLCAPNGVGCGTCGRLAPHAMKSRIQLSIENQLLRAALAFPPR